MMVHSMVQSHQQPSSILQQSRSPVRTGTLLYFKRSDYFLPDLKSNYLYLFLFNYLIFAFDADLDSSEVSRGAGQNAEKSCRICGDRATGLHYGIISCEGEKLIFGVFIYF